MKNKNNPNIVFVKPHKLLKDISFLIRTPEEDLVKEYSESIKTCGQIQAITAKTDTKGFFQVIDGRHRAEACKLLGRDARVEVVNMTDAQAIQAAVVANEKRKPLTGLDKYLVIERMEKAGCTNAEIALTFGWASDSRVSEVKRIGHYPHLVGALRNNTLGLEQCSITAKALSSIGVEPKGPVTEKVVLAVKDWGSVPGFESVKSMVRQLQDGAKFGKEMMARRTERAKEKERLQRIADRKIRRHLISLDFSRETSPEELKKMLAQAERTVQLLKDLIQRAQSRRKSSV